MLNRNDMCFTLGMVMLVMAIVRDNIWWGGIAAFLMALAYLDAKR